MHSDRRFCYDHFKIRRHFGHCHFCDSDQSKGSATEWQVEHWKFHNKPYRQASPANRCTNPFRLRSSPTPMKEQSLPWHTSSGTSEVAPSDQIKRIGSGPNGNSPYQSEQMKKRSTTLPTGLWLRPKAVHHRSAFPFGPNSSNRTNGRYEELDGIHLRKPAASCAGVARTGTLAPQAASERCPVDIWAE